MLTADNALWCLYVLAVIAAVCGLVMHLGRTTHWDAPARDLHTVDPAEAARWDTPPQAPIVWSETAGDHVCAAPSPDLPAEICGWHASHGSCPDHGQLVTPGSTR